MFQTNMLPQLHGQSELSKDVITLNREVAKQVVTHINGKEEVHKIWSKNAVNCKYSYVIVLIRWVFHTALISMFPENDKR
jgi:hypothetical protein